MAWEPGREQVAPMYWATLRPESPAVCLGWDEAFLEDVEAGGPEALWFWESPERFVVLGYGQSAATEANLEACAAARVPVLRRLTGGGAVLQGPGCLNYGLALRIQSPGPLESVTSANEWIMGRNSAALGGLVGGGVAVRGCTDLVFAGPEGERKFGGNAQRRRRQALLFHGTVLLDVDAAGMETYLRHPSSEPAYRRRRPHSDFVGRIPTDRLRVEGALRSVWGASTPHPNPPEAAMREAVRQRYSLIAWNLRR